MGEKLKPQLSAVGEKIVLAVRMRDLTNPESLTKFLGGSDPRKETRDLLEAGVFLDGDDREVVANVLRSTDQSERVDNLFAAATITTGDVQTLAADILTTHKDANVVYGLIAKILAGTGQDDAAVALAIAGRHNEVKKQLLVFILSADQTNDTNRVIIALRFRNFLSDGAIDTRFEAISAHDLLTALPTLVPSEEGKLLSKFLRSKAKVSELFDEAVEGTDDAYEVLMDHTEVNAVVRIIGLKLNDPDFDHVAIAQSLLKDRHGNVLGNAEVVPNLFDAASKGIDGAFEALVNHTKVDAVWNEVCDALLKNVGNANLDRQKTARALVAERADLQHKLSVAIGIEVKATGKPEAAAEKPAKAKKSSDQTPPPARKPAKETEEAEENTESKG